MTGIASFAIPDFSFGFHVRVFRFWFIALGVTTGFLGISVGLFIYVSMLCSLMDYNKEIKGCCSKIGSAIFVYSFTRFRYIVS